MTTEPGSPIACLARPTHADVGTGHEVAPALDSDMAPTWFRVALDDPGTQHAVDVDGVTVRYEAWGAPGAPVIVLVHGGAAHSGWWQHLAPHLSARHRVLAINLSGHGGSGTRTEYTMAAWAGEVMAVALAEGDPRPLVVGHSMGGLVTLTTAHLHGERLRGAVVIDPPEEVIHGRTVPGLAEIPARRHYPTREDAARRFRAKPVDPARLEFVSEHVAHGSVLKAAEGWTWRFDRLVTRHGLLPDSALSPPVCPLVLITGERGLLTRTEIADLADLLGGVPIFEIPDAGHHVMLDQPMALLGTIAGVMMAWAAIP